MAQDYTSYTFKLTDRASTNIYSPYGDGPASSGWQTLPKLEGHNTNAPNASLQISFQGTAITINGYVNSSSGPPAYMLSLDGAQLAQETLDDGRTSQEILLVKNGLEGGYHTVVMSNMEGGNLTVMGVQLSIATGNTRTTWRDTAITTTLSQNALWNPNPFFTFGGNWFPATTSFSPPMLTTPSNGTPSTLSFKLSKCSSFFLYGPMPYSSGAPYNVKITPPVRSQFSSGQLLNSTLGPDPDDKFPSTDDQVLYWENGMDRNMNYTVDISVQSGMGDWGVSKLVVFDAADLAPQSSSSSGKISPGLVVGIIIGFLVLACIGAGSSKKVRSEVWVMKRIA